MSLLDTLKADLLAARKEKNTAAVGVLSTLLGDLETNNKKTGKPIVDSDIVILAKNRVNTIQGLVETVADMEATAPLEAEVPLHEKYISKQLTESEILSIINIFKEINKDIDIGKVQGYFKVTYPGWYDGKVVTKAFQSLEGKV